MDPSWPVFIACSMSRASPPRTSPTMIRSGRMRSELRTRSRMVTSPRPSMFGGRYSRRTTCSCRSCSSTASSMVMMRCSPGMNEESTLSSVVLPVPVPPVMRMLSRPWTQAERSVAISAFRVPRADQVFHLKGLPGELADGESGPVHRQWRDDGVHPGAVGEAGVHHGGSLVDATSHPGGDAVDHPAQRLLGGEAGPGPLETALVLHVDGVDPGHHDLGDGRVPQKGFDGPVAEDVLADLGGDALPLGHGQRGAFLGDQVLELVDDEPVQLSFGDRGVESVGAQLGEQRIAHPRLVLGEAVGGRGASGTLEDLAGQLLLLFLGSLEPVAELHGRPPWLFGGSACRRVVQALDQLGDAPGHQRLGIGEYQRHALVEGDGDVPGAGDLHFDGHPGGGGHLVLVQADAGVRTIEHEVTYRGRHAQQVQSVECFAEVAHAGDVHVRDQHHIGGLLQRGQSVLPEAGGRVDHHIAELGGQHADDGGARPRRRCSPLPPVRRGRTGCRARTGGG